MAEAGAGEVVPSTASVRVGDTVIFGCILLLLGHESNGRTNERGERQKEELQRRVSLSLSPAYQKRFPSAVDWEAALTCSEIQLNDKQDSKLGTDER